MGRDNMSSVTLHEHPGFDVSKSPNDLPCWDLRYSRQNFCYRRVDLNVGIEKSNGRKPRSPVSS